MTAWDDERDEPIRELSRLTTHEPDADRASRGVRRGRSLLAARAGRPPLTARFALRGAWGRALEPLLAAGASAVFLFEVLSRAIGLYRF